MNLIEKYKAWKNSLNPASLNWHNIKNVIKSFYLKAFFRFKPTYYKEQVFYRCVVSEDCIKNKTCLECGCEQKLKILVNEPCAKKYTNDYFCYDYFLSKEEWEKLNIHKDILDYGKKLYYENN